MCRLELWAPPDETDDGGFLEVRKKGGRRGGRVSPVQRKSGMRKHRGKDCACSPRGPVIRKGSPETRIETGFPAVDRSEFPNLFLTKSTGSGLEFKLL